MAALGGASSCLSSSSTAAHGVRRLADSCVRRPLRLVQLPRSVDLFLFPLTRALAQADLVPSPAGETLATFEAVAVLLALFSTFDIAFAPDYLATTPMVQTPLCAEPTPRYRHSLTMPMAQVLRVVATRREAS